MFHYIGFSLTSSCYLIEPYISFLSLLIHIFMQIFRLFFTLRKQYDVISRSKVVEHLSVDASLKA